VAAVAVAVAAKRNVRINIILILDVYSKFILYAYTTQHCCVVDDDASSAVLSSHSAVVVLHGVVVGTYSRVLLYSRVRGDGAMLSRAGMITERRDSYIHYVQSTIYIV